MGVLYTDISGYCCNVLRKNVATGHLPEGVIHEEDIRNIRAKDVSGYQQAHFFAGIGGFPLGFRWAGLPEDFPIWTVGDPCQGNSEAGTVWRKEQQDVASSFLSIADEVRPRFILRENPTSGRKDAVWPWFRFRSHLESIGYAVVPFRLRACCVGSRHKGERLFLFAEHTQTSGQRLQRIDRERVQKLQLRGMDSYQAWERNRDSLATPRFSRRRNGVPSQVDRLTAIGNSADPRMIRWIADRMIRAFSE